MHQAFLLLRPFLVLIWIGLHLDARRFDIAISSPSNTVLGLEAIYIFKEIDVVLVHFYDSFGVTGSNKRSFIKLIKINILALLIITKLIYF